jgi:hypothetical protein
MSLPYQGAALTSIRIWLKVDYKHEAGAACYDLVLSAFAEALLVASKGLSHGWVLKAVPGGSPLVYDLHVQPSEQPLLFIEAWQLIAALHRQPVVAVAQPLFTPLSRAVNC